MKRSLTTELLELEITEEIPEGPSGRVLPLEVLPKGDRDVRVCVDTRRENEAIVRERHPIPTMEEFLHDLNGSTVFSKIDQSSGAFIRFCSATGVDM